MANIKIEIAENGLTTLATAGKYCDRNIDVDVNVAGGGGGAEIPEEAFLITGNARYRFGYTGWNWFLENYGDKITTKDITDATYMFSQNATIEEIPFDINLKDNSSNNLNTLFGNCYKLKSVPYVYGVPAKQTGSYANQLDCGSIFNSCEYLREIPEDWFEVFGNEEYWAARSQYSNETSRIFNNCRSLRKYPRLDNLLCSYSSYNHLYYHLFANCHVLDEVVDLPVANLNTMTSNAFQNTFQNCHRLKRITFKTNEDGTPKTANWKSQTIDLTQYIGIAQSDNNIVGYNSGIEYGTNGRAKMVWTKETYAALKDDPDWWTYYDYWHYSRYDKASAVETINSLPDTSAYLASAGGTNTIKFTGRNGRDTDGGAINTLTEEEIAVATAKGWTVTLV